jgi:hypothetical protein
MKLLFKGKDGGAESTVTGYWLIESKSLFSIALLKFDGNSRQAYHTHAFNCWSFIIKGSLTEHMINGKVRQYKPFRPFITRRTDFHKVDSTGVTWLFTIRSPWADTWREWIPATKKFFNLTHGRKIIEK